MSKYIPPLYLAVQRAGGQTALAKLIGVKQQNVWDWLNTGKRQVSPKYAIVIEAATGVSKHDLRPDIFGPKPGASTPAQREPPREVA